MRTKYGMLITVMFVIGVCVFVFWLDRVSRPVRQQTDPTAAKIDTARVSEAPDSSRSVPVANDKRARPVKQSASSRSVDPEARRVLLDKIMQKLSKRAAAPDAGAGSGPEHAGEPGLQADYIRQQVREIVPLIKECYEMELENQPDLTGNLVVAFEIVADETYGGLVVDSQIKDESTLASVPGLAECVRETIYALHLKAPEQGGRVKVNYPFHFRSERGD